MFPMLLLTENWLSLSDLPSIVIYNVTILASSLACRFLFPAGLKVHMLQLSVSEKLACVVRQEIELEDTSCSLKS